MLTAESGKAGPHRPTGAGFLDRWAGLCFLFGVAGVVFGLWSGASWWLAEADDDALPQIDLAGFAQQPDLMPGARTATGELCRVEMPCAQAVASDTVVLRRFEDPQDAAAAAARLGGDTRVAGSIVIEFLPGGLSEPERAAFAGTVYCALASC